MTDLEILEADLAEVNTSITAVLTGAQEYRSNDGQYDLWVKKGDLLTLKKMRDDIRSQIASINDDGGGFFGF